MLKATRILLVLLLMISSGTRLMAQGHSMSLTSSEKIYGLSKVWQETSYYFSASNDPYRVDGDSLFKVYVPLVIKSANDYEYYRLLQKYAATFQEYHTRVEMPASLLDSVGSVPIVIQEIRGRFYVTNIDKKHLDKMPVGSEIIRINGYDVRTYLDHEVLPYLSGSTLQGRIAAGLSRITEGWVKTRLIMQYLSPDGREHNELFTRAKPDKIQWVNRTGIASEAIAVEWINRETALITLNRFDQTSLSGFPTSAQLSRAQSIIIDLRNNNSEDLGVAIGVAIQLISDSTLTLPGFAVPELFHPFIQLTGSHFRDYGKNDHSLSSEKITLPDTLSVDRTRSGAAIQIIVLTGGRTGNAAEHFVEMLQQGNSQTTIVGEPTAGNTGAPVTFALPGNGQGFVWVRKDFYRLPTLPMTYIRPDHHVTPDVKSLLNGEDPMLNKALELIQKK